MDLLLASAVLPVVVLCSYIYKKDTNREPLNLLLKLLWYGVLTTIPAVILERVLGGICNTDNVTVFSSVFIKVFIGVALAEEGFKWIAIKLKAYDNREFDEIFDIIVYSVFVSLGFALIENILYVLQTGFGTAIMRAVLSVPGHACFAVMMGFFLSKAKVAEINKNQVLRAQNMFLSLLVPMIFHTIYDSILIYYSNVKLGYLKYVFFIFDIIMVIICCITVNKTSKVQQNLNTNLEKGNIIHKAGGLKLVESHHINYCPLCGANVMKGNFCPRCGLRIR